MKRAASYTRKSSTRNQRQVNSHRMQAEEIQHFADANGYQIVESFSDSQTGLNTDRAGWKGFVNWLEASPDNYGIIHRCDRAARTLSVFAEIEHLIPQLRFVQLGPNEPSLTVVSILFAIGRAESEANSQRTRAAYKSIKRKNPDHPWGNPNIAEAAALGRHNAQMKAVQHWTKIVEWDTKLKNMGVSLQEDRISQLNDLGYRTRRGNEITRLSLYRAHQMLGRRSCSQ